MEQERKSNDLSEAELEAQFSREFASIMNLSSLTDFPASLEHKEYDLSELERWRDDE